MQNDESPLKVLHVISGDRWAGAEVQVYTLIKHCLGQCQVSAVVLNEHRLARELTDLGVDVTLIDESRFGSLAILRKLVQVLRRIRPDIVHTHRQKENVLGSIANALSVKAASLRTNHGAPEFRSRGLRRVQVALDHFCGRRLQQGVIAVSEELKSPLASLFGQGKVHRIPNGVDTQTLAAVEDMQSTDPTAIHIGLVGRIEPVKRCDLFIDMAEQLVADHNNLMFHIYGEGSLEPSMRQRATSSAACDVIHFHGHKNDMPAHLKTLDVLVLCSDHEGTPMVALEAMALGKPVIAHRVGGLAELLSDYPELLVGRHDAQGYAEAVSRCLPGLDKLSVKLPEIYTAESNAEATLALYRKLYSGHQSRTDNAERT